jgi:diadenosine tetraphosphate (Ap4A) HIT family hydrolase
MTTDETQLPCLFCTPPGDRIFFSDELVIGLWDAYPVSPGHALLVPRRHIATWFDSSAPERMALVAAIDVAKAIIDNDCRPDGYNIGVNCGPAAGQTIFHLHVHLIPRFFGDVADPRGGVRHVIPKKGNYLGSDNGPIVKATTVRQSD